MSCSSGYRTKAYDDLLAKADSEPLTVSIPDYRALSRQLIDDVVYIPLFYTVDAFLFKPYVIEAGSNNMFDYYWNQIQLTAHYTAVSFAAGLPPAATMLQGLTCFAPTGAAN